MLIYLISSLLTIKFIIELYLYTSSSSYIQLIEKNRSIGLNQPKIDNLLNRKTSYRISKNNFGIVKSIYDFSILIFISISGLIPTLYCFLNEFSNGSVLDQSFILLVLIFILSIPSIPFQYWLQFKLKEGFGLNEYIISVWILDRIKTTILIIFLSYPLIFILINLLILLPKNWWILSLIITSLFQLITIIFYPKIILPLLTNLKPISEGNLKNRLLILNNQLDFLIQSIYCIDGRKRSSDPNAFFSGYGKYKCIVLFDSLMKKLTNEEIESVIVHEIGHGHLKHIQKMFSVSVFILYFNFFFLSCLCTQNLTLTQFGFSVCSTSIQTVPLFSIFLVVGDIVTFFSVPFVNYFSHKYEYEADRFVKKNFYNCEIFTKVLKKIHTQSRILISSRTTSAFRSSHPELSEREKFFLF